MIMPNGILSTSMYKSARICRSLIGRDQSVPINRGPIVVEADGTIRDISAWEDISHRHQS